MHILHTKTDNAGKRRLVRFAVFGLFFAVVLFPLLWGDALGAEAGSGSDGIADIVLNQLKTSSKTWSGLVRPFSITLLLSLSLISLVWSTGPLIFAGGDLGSVFYKVIKHFVYTGGFYYLIKNGPEIMETLYLTVFRLAGSTADAVKPSVILAGSFKTFALVMTSITDPTSAGALLDTAGAFIFSGFKVEAAAAKFLFPYFMITLTWAMILLGIVITALVLVEMGRAYILVFCGYFYFAFGGCEWTRPMVTSYMKTIISVCVSVLMLMMFYVMFCDSYTALTTEFLKIAQGGDGLATVRTITPILATMLMTVWLMHSMPPTISRIVEGVSSAPDTPFTPKQAQKAGWLVASVATYGASKGVEMAAKFALEKLKKATSTKGK